MNYTLYVNDDCPSCDKMVRFLESIHLNFRVINLSHGGDAPTGHVLIVPALFEDKRLVAYGPDIKSRFA